MPIVLHSQGVGEPVLVQDLNATHGPHKVGRWCKPPHVPDRCDFCELADIRPAIGYVTEQDGWRHGYCERHKGEADASLLLS